MSFNGVTLGLQLVELEVLVEQVEGFLSIDDLQKRLHYKITILDEFIRKKYTFLSHFSPLFSKFSAFSLSFFIPSLL